MTAEEAIARMKEIAQSGDQEIAHVEADGVLCDLLYDLGYEAVVAEYHKIDKWYA